MCFVPRYHFGKKKANRKFLGQSQCDRKTSGTMHDVDSISLPQRRTGGRKRSVADESVSFSTSETSAHSNRRHQDRSVIFETRLEFALVIIGLQTGATQLMFIFIASEQYGGVLTFLIICVITIFITLPLMVHEMFYGFYNKFGFLKFWNIAPVSFGIGFTMAMYSVYECVVWAAVAGLLILHVCYLPFRSLSEWRTCQKTERPEGVICYDVESKSPGTSCDNSTYPALEFYREISYKPQSDGSSFSGINGGWFVCCFVVWLIVFVMVSQGFRRLKNILIRVPIFCLLSLILLAFFSFGTMKRVRGERKEKIFHVQESPSRYAMVWLVWHALRMVQIPLGTLCQLGSYSPPESPLLTDTVMILLFACFYNFGFTYFAHCCHAWLEQNFVAIERPCLAPDEMSALFASVPTAISFLAMGNLWLFVFYTAFALKTITQIVITLTATMNAMSETFHLHRHRQQIVAVLCTLALLLDLPLTMMNSETFLKKTYRLVEILVDLAIVSASGSVVVSLYTLSRVFDDIHFHYKAEPSMFQKLISYLSPVLMVFVVITWYMVLPSQWAEETVFQDDPWAAIFILITTILLLAPIPVCAFYMYVVHLMKHDISAMLQPTTMWGPPEPEAKRARLIFNPRSELRYKSKKPCTHNCLLNNFRIKIEVEKRDSQRKEFFLNIFQSRTYAEWDDDEELWHYEGDIIGKARAINWAGDFGRVFNPEEEERLNQTGKKHHDELPVENMAGTEDDLDSDEDPEEDVRVEENTDTVVNASVEETLILKKDGEIETEMEFQPDIILPDLNSGKLRPGIRYLDVHEIPNRTPPTPRYTVEHPNHLRKRSWRGEERSIKAPIEPVSRPLTRKTYPKVERNPKRQSRSKSCQTDKGIKRLKNLVQAMLPWKRSHRKKHRCVGTNPDHWPSAGCRKRRSPSDSSKDSEPLSETDEWP